MALLIAKLVSANSLACRSSFSNNLFNPFLSFKERFEIKLLFRLLSIQIVIDLSELTFMDSTGVGVLIGRYKKMRECNKPIFITNPSRNAERIFKMSGLYEIMPKIV